MNIHLFITFLIITSITYAGMSIGFGYLAYQEFLKQGSMRQRTTRPNPHKFPYFTMKKRYKTLSVLIGISWFPIIIGYFLVSLIKKIFKQILIFAFIDVD